MEGAIGISQMKKLNSFLIQRRKNANILLKNQKFIMNTLKFSMKLEIVVGFLL